VAQPTIMMSTEKTMIATIGITSKTKSRSFSRKATRSTV
jgi:hypothetical protein